MFKDKTLLITGGTGSFGNAVMKRFLGTDVKEIRIFLEMKKNKMICENYIKTISLSSILVMCVI